MADGNKQGRRVAVVGSGLAGLATSYMLQKSGFVVELFEQENSIGMDAGSLTVDGVRIDVPFRVFTPDYYPYLYSLYTHLGIEFAAADYSLGFTGDRGESIWSYTNSTIGDFQMPIPDSIYKTDRTRVTRNWLRLVFACVRVMRTPRVLQPGGRLDKLTIGEYLNEEQYSTVFIEHVFLPFIASLLTCSLRAAREYPATTILHFVAKAVCGARLRKARRGVQHVCHVLAQGLCVHLSTRVDAIEVSDTSDKGRVNVVTGDKSHWFDDIVLATPADVSARLLRTSGCEFPSDLVDALTSVLYEDTEVVTHRDERVMPAQQAEWRGVNIRTHDGHAHAMASHWINHVERTSNGQILSSQVFQTVDPLLKLDSSKVIGSTHFRRSLVTLDSQSRINSIHKHQGTHKVWFVGSYTSPGVPLLEGCVRTAVDVVRAMSGRVVFGAPRMERSGYEVGLGERMARGEVVEAFFECDAARTFHSEWPKHGRLWVWMAFGVLLPIVALVVDMADMALGAVLGRDIACRVQFAVMDVFVFVVCMAQMAYSRITAL
ncbi:hypothetical protein GGH96_002400 [Coemansia sp. RSA 1972]|nr:hypothetical protein GGH96_002400 [Coemansia sp. RSA 1972]